MQQLGLSQDTSYFQSPVDHRIVLAGSFGELRSSHFHAGVDIKPAGKLAGDTLRAAAAGRLSRVKVQVGGYGQAVYIDHPNGYTTVYAHLMKFEDSLQAYVESMQRAAQSYEVDLHLDTSRFSYEQGQYIGLMGNTGRSYATHLHFEIRHTASEVPIDPALCGISATDAKAPVIQSYSIEGLTPDYRRTMQDIYYPTAQVDQGEHVVPAWRVGINVQAYDQMDGSTNRNGVYHRQLFVDGALHWESRTDAVDWDETKYIKAYVDYHDRTTLNRTAVCGYVLPGNPLSLYTDSLPNDPIALYKDRAREIRIVLSDIAGNTTEKRFALRRAANIPAPVFEDYNVRLHWDTAYHFALGRTAFDVEDRTFARDVYFKYGEDGCHHHLHEASTPAFRDIATKIKIEGYQSEWQDQYCLVYMEDNRPTSYGGRVVGDSLQVAIRALGHFEVRVDSLAPSIEPVGWKKVVGNEGLAFQVDDNYACKGNARDVAIDVWIDGEWQISPYKIMTRRLDVPTSHLVPGEHEIVVVARDDRGNDQEWRAFFVKK